MRGDVDERNRALITISVSSEISGQYENVVAWIDTAFDGHLVFSASLIHQLGLESLVETEAILADGSKVALETFVCFLDWFGERIPVQIMRTRAGFRCWGLSCWLDASCRSATWPKSCVSIDSTNLGLSVWLFEAVVTASSRLHGMAAKQVTDGS